MNPDIFKKKNFAMPLANALNNVNKAIKYY